MANIRQLLLPYAYDSTGNLVHIDDAHKGETYKCPECGNILSLNISKIPKGQKYHRRNHFSHSKGTPDNQCTESFLHKLFKTRAKECIQNKIDNQETEFKFTWQCDECNQQHQGNMLKKAVSVHLEYDLGICQPDIALLDKNGKVVIVIEVVVTHKPEEKVLQYYTQNKIGCLQICVSDFEDCENVENKLMHPNSVNLCPTPNCEFCGKKLQKDKISIITAQCWKCNNDMPLALIIKDYRIIDPSSFTEKAIEIANRNGANIRKRYSKTTNSQYYANVCPKCNAFVGSHYAFEYVIECEFDTNTKEIEIGYTCYHCKELEEEKKHEEMVKRNRRYNELYQLGLNKQCPKCGKQLTLRDSKNGFFYGCMNYPHCRYTENITEEE